MKPQGKLNLPCVGDDGSDRPRRRRADAPARQAEIRVIQNVEELGAELESKSLGQPEILVGAEIPRRQSRPDEHIPARVAKRILRRRDEAFDVVPLADGLLRGG